MNEISNITNNFDAACNFCIRVLEELSKACGMSYGELNIWLFVIIQPALILLFLTTTVLLLIKVIRRDKQQNRIAAIVIPTILVVSYAVIVTLFFLILVPIYEMC